MLITKLQRDENGEWEMTGKLTLPVTEESATRTGLKEQMVPRALDKDHSALVKCDFRWGNHYPRIKGCIRDMVEAAIPAIARRFAGSSRFILP